MAAKRSVVALLRATVDGQPDRDALIDLGPSGGLLTYRELWDHATRVAGGLRAAGVRRGDRVAIRYGDGIDWVLAFFGTLMAGAAAVPVNATLPVEAVDDIVRDATPRVVLTPGPALPDGRPYVVADLASAELAAIFYPALPPVGPHPYPAATHGAMTTHGRFCAHAVRAGVRAPLSAPLSHVTSCTTHLLPTLHIGETLVLGRPPA